MFFQFVRRHLAHFYGVAALVIFDFFYIGTILPWMVNADSFAMAFGLFSTVIILSLTAIAIVAWVQSFTENNNETRNTDARRKSRRPRG